MHPFTIFSMWERSWSRLSIIKICGYVRLVSGAGQWRAMIAILSLRQVILSDPSKNKE
ncbi:MAG: hypothetical protein ACI9JM_001212 [Halioglobus sp.]|jgi:hypothetical protein